MNFIYKLALQRFSTRTTRIQNIVSENVVTSHFQIINESKNHSVPKDSETHFKLIIVSEMFKSLSLIQRQRMINELLSQEFKTGLHALSVVAKTNDEWSLLNNTIDPSPLCRGGSKSN